MKEEIDILVKKLETYNRAYRAGQPLISDEQYDVLVEKLRTLDPTHPFLSAVEPETFGERKQVRHPSPMLSLEKAYSDEQLARFLLRVRKEADALGIAPVVYKVTPKLDGLAARDDGDVFATRGNGYVGYEISNAFDKGVEALEGRGQGLGEIVVVKDYFEEHLADKFEHPRNMVVGIISSDTLNQDVLQALEEGMVRFVPYRQLRSRECVAEELLGGIDEIATELIAVTEYPTDGVVVEALDQRIQQRMGATAHHYRWQIAVKRKGATAETTVEDILWQVGRTGNITPVMKVAPVSLSGATIRRVTAHHAGMVANLGIGPGARIEIIRSGEVIPKLERVLERAQQVSLPQNCPVCGQPLSFRGEKADFLRCGNPNCMAQAEQRIVHWFRILGNADWFGVKTVQRLVNAGCNTLEKIYALKADDFAAMGFGPVQSKNLAAALAQSRTQAVEEWRFLAALGIPDLGTGDSRRLLQHMPIEKVPEAEEGEVSAINGFGPITSRSIVQGIRQVRGTLCHLLELGFNLQRQPVSSSEPDQSPIKGKKLVFTGKMVRGSREEMQAEALRLGAVVQTAVSGSTNLLVCGEKVGAAKMEKAARLGVAVITEDAYHKMLADSAGANSKKGEAFSNG